MISSGVARASLPQRDGRWGMKPYVCRLMLAYRARGAVDHLARRPGGYSRSWWMPQIGLVRLPYRPTAPFAS